MGFVNVHCAFFEDSYITIPNQQRPNIKKINLPVKANRTLLISLK